MKYFPLLLLLVMCFSAEAQDGEYMFRREADSLVREGNAQYMRSNRKGIVAAADKLNDLLIAHHTNLSQEDSLEYYGQLHKLRADYHYENEAYDPDSYAYAEEELKQAANLFSVPVFRNDLYKLPMIHREFAQLYYCLERYDDALTNISAAEQAYAVNYGSKFEDGDPLFYEWQDIRMQQALCLARIGCFSDADTISQEVLHALLGDDNPERYFESLRKRGKILYLAGAGSDALSLYHTYFDWRRTDVKTALLPMTSHEREDYWMRMRPFVTDCFLLGKDADPAFLYDVALFSKSLLLQMNRIDRNTASLFSLDCRWEDIQRILPSNAAAIEFVQSGNAMTALVLKEKGEPTRISVPGMDSFMDYTIDGQSNRHRMSRTSGFVKNALYDDVDFTKTFWNKDLCDALSDCDKVYFAPDAYLHQLAIEYMLPPELEHISFYRLSSTRRLMEPATRDLDSALLVGGVTYESVSDTLQDINDAEAYRLIKDKRPIFNYLEWTKAEASDILSVRNSPSDTLLTGPLAGEARIRALAPHYSILNLSTHGLFSAATVPAGTDLKPCLTDDSMSESVLVLAGASAALRDDGFDVFSADGLLSAAEVAKLNLENVGLAVISACETGLGRISYDGVYGLQRGFKNAGADCLVVSLWDVNDMATRLLMTTFHSNLVSGMSIHDAFFDAREQLGQISFTKTRTILDPASLSPRRETLTYDFHRPQYMDAFILIDAIE